MKIVGIVNITNDSFSDGGTFLDTGAAIAQAKKLLEDGADIIELSGASSNPRSESVPADVEIGRIASVLEALDCPISIDATKKEVQRFALARGVAYLNDIKGFPDESIYPELARASAKLVVMHAITDTDKADRAAKTTQEVFESLYSFFEKRIPALEREGIARERMIIDPGMGFFLSSKSEPSYAVLEHLSEFKSHFDLPVMVSVSRKSFLRKGALPLSREVAAHTLELELTAAKQGVDYIRTHETQQLKKALEGQGLPRTEARLRRAPTG